MKKVKHLLFISFVLIIIQLSCKNEDEFIPGNSIDENQMLGDYLPDEDGKVKNYILNLGFTEEDIEELDEYYLVDNDILFHKTREIVNSDGLTNGKTGQAHTDSRVSSGNANILIYIDPNIPEGDTWRNALGFAISDWNSVPDCKVTLKRTFDRSLAKIIVKSDQGILRDDFVAAADFPSSGQPGQNILINLDFYNNYPLTISQKRNNLVHEVGHTLGLRHTNWSSSGESFANHIPGTPNSDANSVMNGGTALNAWSGFSNYDIIAAQYLFPIGLPSSHPSWLIFPNGTTYAGGEGERFEEGQTITITWNKSLVSSSNVKLELYYNEGLEYVY